MDNPFVISLVVSGVGMLMLFLALAFLYGLMYLMTALIKDRHETEEIESGERATGSEGQESEIRKLRAAAIAVALARAEQDLSPVGAPGALGAEEMVSGWRALHHQRQLGLNVLPRRTR